jgi:D-inositol-3-phosphate glycosyltransferase
MGSKGSPLKKETLRIAMISMHSSPVGELGTRDTGGMSVYVGEVAERLAAKGCAIDIFTRRQAPDTARVLSPCPGVRVVHLVAGPPGVPGQMAFCEHLPEFFENLEHFRREQGIEYQLVHSHYYLSGQVGIWAQERWKVPHVFMAHTLGAVKNRVVRSLGEPAFRVEIERRVAAECDLILAASEGEKRHFVELYGAEPKKIRVLRCGVNLRRFHPPGPGESRPSGQPGDGRRVVLYVGRFDPIKGVDRLIEAVALLRDEIPLKLILVGGGGQEAPEDRALRTLCSALSLDGAVAFEGRKTHNDLPDYYRGADMLVLPSHYESFGLVVLEALACGTPVLATRVGVVEEIVENGVNGWSIPDNNPARLAEGIRSTLKWRDSQVVASDAIRATVRGYDWDSVAGCVHAEYRKLLEPAGAPGERRFTVNRQAEGNGCVPI